MNVVEIVFSPTGGTEKVAHIIGKHWSENPAKIDLSDAKTNFNKCGITEQDMVLIAMPSFGGRAPAVAIERLKQIAGNGAKCTLVCVYGNRYRGIAPIKRPEVRDLFRSRINPA